MSLKEGGSLVSSEVSNVHTAPLDAPEAFALLVHLAEVHDVRRRGVVVHEAHEGDEARLLIPARELHRYGVRVPVVQTREARGREVG